MANHETAETQYITVKETKLAYRRLGPSSGTPLVMLMHFRGNMDFWDPLLINTLSQTRPLLLLDSPGIGKSAGEIPTTFNEQASYIISLIHALGITKIDLLGFSMGGAAAQHVTLAAPGLVRKLILAGTRTSRTPNTVIGPRKIFHALAHSETEEEFREAFLLSFFPPTPAGRSAGLSSWERIMTRTQDRAPHLSPVLAKRQTAAFAKFSVEGEGTYERIHELKMPVFVANGDDDLLIPTVNSVELAGLLPDAHLHIYPKAGHGFLYQYAELFAKHIALFLDGEVGEQGMVMARI